MHPSKARAAERQRLADLGWPKPPTTPADSLRHVIDVLGPAVADSSTEVMATNGVYGDNIRTGLTMGDLRALAAEQDAIRAQVADEIAAVADGNRKGVIDRPKYETGGYLNDFDWAEKIARGAGNTRQDPMRAMYQHLLSLHMNTLRVHGPDMAAGLALAIGEIHRLHPEVGPTEAEEIAAEHRAQADALRRAGETVCPNCHRRVATGDNEDMHAGPCQYCGSDGHASCQCGEQATADALRRADEYEARHGDQRNVHLGGQAWRNLPQYRDGGR